MKKILFVFISLYNGGAEKSLINLLNELPKDKYEIDLLLFRREGTFLNQVPEYVNIIDAPIGLREMYTPLNKAGWRSIIKIVGTVVSRVVKKQGEGVAGFRWKHFYGHFITELSKEYDVAAAYGTGEPLYFVLDKTNARKKYVWVHNDYRKSSFDKKYDYVDYGKTDGIISISEECVNILKEEFPEYRDKIYCIPNITSSVVVNKRANCGFPKEFHKDEFNILSIGRLSYQKGFDYAIDAAKILKERNVHFKWYILGDGELYKSLLQKVAMNHVDDCVCFLGIRENPYPYIKNCDIFVQSSRYEGKSVVLDEAKILAKPIIVTSYPTVRDQIMDGKEGVIVGMTSEKIADGIEELIKNKEKRVFLSNYLAAHEYGNQDAVEKYMTLFDED